MDQFFSLAFNKNCIVFHLFFCNIGGIFAKLLNWPIEQRDQVDCIEYLEVFIRNEVDVFESYSLKEFDDKLHIFFVLQLILLEFFFVIVERGDDLST